MRRAPQERNPVQIFTTNPRAVVPKVGAPPVPGGMQVMLPPGQECHFAIILEHTQSTQGMGVVPPHAVYKRNEI
eukprot:4758761-Amphidinium_carterae.1